MARSQPATERCARRHVSPAVGWLLLLALAVLLALEVAEPRPAYLPAREIGVTWRDGGWEIHWMLPSGQLADTGLRRGDLIRRAGDLALTAADDPAVWLARPADLLIERDGRAITVSLAAARALDDGECLAYGLAAALFGLVGVLTWVRSGGGRVQAAFLLLCAAASVGLAAAPATWRGHPWAAWLLFGGATATVTGLLVFVRLFPTVRPFRLGRRRLAPEWLWLAPALLTGVYLADLTGLLPGAVDQVAPARAFWHLLMLVAMLTAVGQSWRLARRTQDRHALTQLRIVGGGAVLGFLPLLGLLGLNAAAGRTVINPVVVVPLTALLPLSVAYAMLRYRVMDVDLVVRRSLVWGAAAAVYGLALVAVLETLSALDPGAPQPLREAVTVGAALVLLPLFNLLVRHLDRAVYGRGHDPRQTLAAAARTLATTLDERRVLALALERILDTLQPALVILYEHSDQSGYAPVAWQRRHEELSLGPAPAPLAAGHVAFASLAAGRSWQAGGTLLRGDATGPETDPARPALLVPAGPALETGPARWLLGLAPRPSGLPYSHEDIALLEALAQGLATALLNARHYGGLQHAYADLRQTQLQLVQATKMATLGEVASGIAHELNQPLMVMRARLQQLLPQTEEPLRLQLQRLERQTEKMARIINHLRSFARQSHDERRPVALAQVIDEALLLLGEQLRERGIAVEVASTPDLPLVLADPGQLEQVVLNLLGNARDALAGQPDPRIGIAVKALDGPPPQLVLSISDTGAGIPPEQLERIFEPFFTTKAEGQGTGLGLSISRGIVERHGGRIEVESTPGAGTTFHVLLPAQAGAAPACSPSVESAA
jgi:signal transduction histidine kinase